MLQNSGRKGNEALSWKYVGILTLGTIAMFIVMVLQPRETKKTKFMLAMISIVLTITGTLGTYLMYYVENGYWGGQSFFGAVFFVPLAFLGAAFIFKISYNILMDICAPAECIMLALFKLNCYVSGCCAGKVIWYREEGIPVFFPSQIVEMVCAILIMFVLFRLEKRKGSIGKIYPYYLLIYGLSRYILNRFRWDSEPFIWKLPPGNFWALCAICIAIIWLFGLKLKEKRGAKTDSLSSVE